MSGAKIEQPVGASAVSIPNGTPFVIVDLDMKNELVQIEYSLDGRVVRVWVPAANFQKLSKN